MPERPVLVIRRRRPIGEPPELETDSTAGAAPRRGPGTHPVGTGKVEPVGRMTHDGRRRPAPFGTSRPQA
jgi:hypothetical protein